MLVLSSGTVYANGNGNKGAKGSGEDCFFVPPGLQKALENGKKNGKARAAIQKNIEKHKNKSKCNNESEFTDSERVILDQASLQIGFRNNDTAQSVTGPIQLTSKGKLGSTITWVSSHPLVISHNGLTVNRPSSTDVNVTLTATIGSNQAISTKLFVLTVKSTQQITDVQSVAADKAALQIGFRGDDQANRVTQALKALPTTGAKGSTITWVSGNAAVISNNGQTVNRPAAGSSPISVSMIATISKGNASDIKVFQLTVQPQLSDAQRIAADKQALEIKFRGTDTANRVTQALQTLPTSGSNGSTITWISGNHTVISNNGQTVNRPAAGSGDVNIPMTAIISLNSVSDTKVFNLTVKQQLTDTQKVAADKAALGIEFGGSDTVSRVTRPLNELPLVGVNGSTINWISSSPHILSNDGQTINRPSVTSNDVTVVLTAVINSNGITDTKSFNLTIKREFTNAEKVAADKADLAITYATDDSANSVTKPLVLATEGYYGSSVVWYSSHPSIISNNGKTVQRPAAGTGDVIVTLTAIISNQTTSDVKSFQVTVKQQ
jgi:hypothetical protein